MISIIIACLVTVAVGWMLIKRYPSQMVLLLGGLVIIIATILCGAESILPKGIKTTGFIGFDSMKLLGSIAIKQVGGIGMIVMVSGGFAGYMSQIGAFDALVKLVADPLNRLSKPYLLLAIAYIIGQLLNTVIISAAGLTMLLLVSFYPILLRVGVSAAAAASSIVLATSLCTGPLFGTQQLAARTVGLDPMTYMVEYQLICTVPALLAMAVTLFFTQRWFDKKNDDVYGESVIEKPSQTRDCPAWYAIFPFVPIVLLFVFSKFAISSIKLGVIEVLFMTWIVVVFIEMIRLKDLKLVLKDAMVMFKKMGQIFGGIVALVICAEFFATSLRISGLVDAIINMAFDTGFGVTGMTAVLSAITGGLTLIVGSAIAAFATFASLSADIHNNLGGNLGGMVNPMHLAGTVFRSMSPVAGCVIAAALAAGVSPIAICRRTAIPCIVGFAVIWIMNSLFNTGTVG